jgi:hypothetical protein
MRGQLIQRATFLVFATLSPGCGPIIEVHCADANAKPVITRDNAGRLRYEGCRVENADGSSDNAPSGPRIYGQAAGHSGGTSPIPNRSEQDSLSMLVRQVVASDGR